MEQSSVIKDFYFTCENCKKTHSFDEFQYSIIFTGLTVLVNNLDGYFGILCPECKKATINNFPIEQIHSIWDELNDPKGMIKIRPKDDISFLYSKEKLSTKILSYHSFSNYPNNSEHTHLLFDDIFIHTFDYSSVRDLNLQTIYETMSMNENNFYLSYLPDTTIDRGVVLIQGIRKEEIYKIIELENQHQRKIIPRYYYQNNLQQRSNKYCFNQSREYIYSLHEDERESKIYCSLEKSFFEKSEFLKLIKEAGSFYDTVKQNNYKLIIPSKKTLFNEIQETKSNLNKIKFNAGSYSTRWSDILKKIGDQFTDEHIQNVLQKGIDNYRIAYAIEAEKIDFSVISIIKLSAGFIKGIEGLIKNKGNKEAFRKPFKETSKIAAQCDQEYPSLKKIISNDHWISMIKKGIVNIYSKNARPVLILGETGTGKELIAMAIYDVGFQKQYFSGQLVSVNCAAIEKNLLESELFGHEKGSFTGATNKRIGLIEHAHNGVLFLDEIGELNINHQAKLLRALECKTITRVGGTKEKKINFKLVCATNRDLEKDIEKGKFKNDFFYRISLFNITLPPLRERNPEDIKLLSEYFLKEIENEYGVEKELTSSSVKKLTSYSWPGNIRELKNILERNALLSEGKFIEINSSELPEPKSENSQKEEIKSNHKLTYQDKRELTGQKYLDALEKHNWNRTKAAIELGVHRKTVTRHIDILKAVGKKVPPPANRKKP